MNTRKTKAVPLALALAFLMSAQPNPERYLDNVVIGYQGWFGAPGDGSRMNRWVHWSRSTPPARNNVTFELYPDVSDYDPQDLFATRLGDLGSGQPSRLFSSYSERVTDLHFRWMAEHNLDGVALQRFIINLDDPAVADFRNKVAQNVKQSAEKHGRVFLVEYDVSGSVGALERTWVERIQQDWMTHIEEKLAPSPQYAKQDGKPVVIVWGPGFSDRVGTAEESLALVKWFQERNVYIGLGVPYRWRTTGAKPGFLAAYESADLILPWTVGTYRDDNAVTNDLRTIAIPDRDWCRDRGIAYQRVIYPGFAWSNWNGLEPNLIPRRGGRFLWKQALALKSEEIPAFVAMFDEYDEATAIAKAAEDKNGVPADQYFLALDADGASLSSDFYLRLAGAITRLFHNQMDPQDEAPVPAR
ncbi:MAG: xylosidase/arabinosidase [Acidobacteria bacterium]|nr:xylosidase/arabinosidase [Acidobacteriota bacterium]